MQVPVIATEAGPSEGSWGDSVATREMWEGASPSLGRLRLCRCPGEGSVLSGFVHRETHVFPAVWPLRAPDARLRKGAWARLQERLSLWLRDVLASRVIQQLWGPGEIATLGDSSWKGAETADSESGGPGFRSQPHCVRNDRYFFRRYRP